jgi:hypothetical protein
MGIFSPSEREAFERAVTALERIADRLDDAWDKDKKAIRLFDVARADVYRTHLGKKLTKSKKRV